MALARRYAAQGKVLIVAPDSTCGVSTLKRDASNMRKLYGKGYGDGVKIVPFLKTWDGKEGIQAVQKNCPHALTDSK